jgi:uncharacterized OsmC-like protein
VFRRLLLLSPFPAAQYLNPLSLGWLCFEVTARQHKVISDQPVESGGFDEGMTPPELMLASLGSCAGYYAAQYLKKRQLTKEGTRVRVMADKVPNPARLDNFRIELEVPVELGERHKAGIEDAVHRCLIHNTLLRPPKITLNVKTVGLVAA